MDLNEFAFQKLKEIRTNRRKVISFANVRAKICTHFSIKKACCHKLLVDFRNEGKIEYVHCRGIRIKDGRYGKRRF